MANASARLGVMLVILVLPLVLISAGSVPPAWAPAPAVDFRQCANDDPTLGQCHFINSILQQQNSVYYEGMGVWQRALFDDVPSGAHTLLISHQAAKGTIHAYDFLISWQQAKAVADGIQSGLLPTINTANTCAADVGPQPTGAECTAIFDSGISATASVPDTMGTAGGTGEDTDTRIAAFETQFGSRVVEIFASAGTITAATLDFDGYDTGGGASYATYSLHFTTSLGADIGVRMAGHLAVSVGSAAVGGSGVGYGSGKGSSNINGGPYHFKLDTFDGASLGSQDNQIKGADILALPGQITIVKDAIPDDPQDFLFTKSGTLSGTFYLDDDPTDSTLQNQETIAGVTAGDAIVTEDVPLGWDLTSISCVVSGGATWSSNLAAHQVTVNPGDAGGSATCTFTDTKRGHIIVDKVTVPSGESQSFGFTPSWGAGFSLTDAATPRDSGALVPGTYSVSEDTPLPLNWDLTSATCDDSSPVNAIVLDPGETVTCTFTDTKREGEIQVIKTADAASVSAGDSIGFTITVTNTGAGTATGVTLSDPLPGGTSVSWSIDSADYDCSISGSPPSETLTCNIGSLAPGASFTVHVTSSTTEESCDVYDNTASVTSTNNGSDEASASIEVICPAPPVGGAPYSVNKLALLSPYLALLALLGALGLALAARRRRIV